MSRFGAKYICKDLSKVQVLQKNVSTCTSSTSENLQVQVQSENLEYMVVGVVHNWTCQTFNYHCNIWCTLSVYL